MDPDNGLFDAACDLLWAAQRVDRAVRRDGVEAAIPATLGCLHSTLAALTSACAALSSNDPPGRNEALEDLVFVCAEPPRRATLRERAPPNLASSDLGLGSEPAGSSLPRVVRLSSERARQAVRQDCSFAKRQESPQRSWSSSISTVPPVAESVPSDARIRGEPVARLRE
jgi:hypothetical protein